MKKIIIIEDEQPAAKRLRKLVTALSAEIEILEVIDSVEDAVEWFENNPAPDLAFFDIQLADGISFSIFEKVEVKCPVIFTTAYDQYAIKAFKVNSIDYLLKPIDPDTLDKAWNKYLNLQSDSNTDLSSIVAAFKEANQKKNYKERFLIKKGEQFKYLTINEVAYFISDDGLTFLIDKNGKRFIVDDKLDALENALDPRTFFRINRKLIISDSSVNKINAYFNSRLKLELSPTAKDEVIVARERVSTFKKWLND